MDAKTGEMSGCPFHGNGGTRDLLGRTNRDWWPDQLQVDMAAPEIDAHIETSRNLAGQLGISGTPTFLIGETLVPGLLEKADLQALISEAEDVG